MVKNKKHFSPLGTKLYFHVNSSKKKICCVDHHHTTNMAVFCVFKYTVRTNSLPKAENAKRDWRETLGFFSPAPHTRRACEARALRVREALTLLFSPVN